MRDIEDLERKQNRPDYEDDLPKTTVIEIQDPLETAPEVIDAEVVERRPAVTEKPQMPVPAEPKKPVQKKKKSKKANETAEPKENKTQRRLSPAVRFVLKVILAASIVTGCYSGFQLYLGNKAYRESENAYSKLAEDTGGTEEVTLDNGETTSYTKADFTALAKINPDVVGWLTLEGTVIDYPVVHGSDNEYYLEHLFTGETNHTGCIFVDAENKGDFTDRNTVLYAHHMRNGSMFAELEGYRNQAFYESHRSLFLQTPQGNYQILPFAGLLSNGSTSFNRIYFESDEDFMSFISDIRAQSTFSSDVPVSAGDQVLTMSTCRYDAEDGRFAVFGKLVKIS